MKYFINTIKHSYFKTVTNEKKKKKEYLSTKEKLLNAKIIDFSYFNET